MRCARKCEEMRKETEKKVTDVLTADQKTALEKMKGKKLDIPRVGASVWASAAAGRSWRTRWPAAVAAVAAVAAATLRPSIDPMSRRPLRRMML